MKQFTEAQFNEAIDKSFDEGVAKGFEQGVQTADHLLKAKAANQRRELRRLNSKLNEIYRGVKINAVVYVLGKDKEGE